MSHPGGMRSSWVLDQPLSPTGTGNSGGHRIVRVIRVPRPPPGGPGGMQMRLLLPPPPSSMDMPFNVQMVHSIPSPPLNIPQMQLNQGPPVHVPPAMMLQFGDSNALHSQMLQEVLKHMSTDETLTLDVRELALKHIDNAKELMPQISFLFNEFQPSTLTNEQSWIKFHASMQTNCLRSGNNPFMTWLCFRLFKRLLLHSPQQNQKSICTSFGKTDMEIVAYIGGSILQKIRKHAIRLKDQNKHKANFLSCLEKMIDNNNITELVSVKTRGGLLNASSGMLRILAIMEKKFRTLFGVGDDFVVEMSENSFTTSVLSKELVDEFSEMIGLACENESDKLVVLRKTVALFFKIRAHNKASKLLVRKADKKKIALKDKALRKKLKQQ